MSLDTEFTIAGYSPRHARSWRGRAQPDGRLRHREGGGSSARAVTRATAARTRRQRRWRRAPIPARGDGVREARTVLPPEETDAALPAAADRSQAVATSSWGVRIRTPRSTARASHTQAGIAVDDGVLGEAAKQLNAAYFKRIQRRRPYVTLKWAQTADGKIAGAAGRTLNISNAASRRSTSPGTAGATRSWSASGRC